MNTPQQILKKHWGYSAFRPLQEEIINSVITGKDTLALLPTGGGKSLCFQVPGIIMEGICFVVSPLIALMKDQVSQLNNRGINARAIYSGMSPRDIDITLDNCIYGDIKFLYLSPERLKSEVVVERAKRMSVNLLVIDEAHCISQWGYDFRPPYLEISQFKSVIPHAGLVALTATATKEVQQDIIEKLAFKEPKIFQKSFVRKNLSYSVFQKENKRDKLLEILRKVPGSSVVYAKNRKRTEVIANLLREQGIIADHYHAGLSNSLRSEKQESWISGKTRVMVATNAFGMGIDKADVRTVIHMDIPDSPENYYQEAGRAGRDEKKAYAVLLYDQQDLSQLSDHLDYSFPPIDQISKCYQALANYYRIAVGSNFLETYDFDLEGFSQYARYKQGEAFNLISKLADHGLVQLSESFYQPSRVFISIAKTDLYKFEVANPKFEKITKSLMRLYGGELFTDFVDIRESQIGSLINESVKDVEKKLNFLSENGVIRYTKQKNKPQLTFLTPRLDHRKLGLDIRKIESRKEVKTRQVEAIKKYALSIDRCRTRIFQEYFGEKAFADCGNCDYCLRRKKIIKADLSIKEQILKLLVDAELNLDEASRQLPTINEEEFIFNIRELLEEGKVVYSDLGRLKKV